MKRKEYYKAELFRAIIYPVVFLIVVLLFSGLGVYYGEPIKLDAYVNLAVITLIATLICYLLSYTLAHRRRGR